MKSSNKISKHYFGASFAVALVVFLALSVCAKAQNLLIDGSFESPVEPAQGDYVFNADGWTSSGDFNEIINGTIHVDLYYGTPTPEDGAQDAFFYSSIAQTFEVTSPGTYALSWFDNNVLGFYGTYNVTVSSGTLGTIYSGDFSGYVGSETWDSQVHDLNLQAGSYTLTFNNVGPNDTQLDNVSIESAPEPTAYALVLGGLTLLAFFRLRTRRA